MKKYIIIPLILGSILGFSFISMRYEFIDLNVKSLEIYYPDGGEYDQEIVGIPTLIQLSDTVVKAELLSKKLVKDNNSFEYSFLIENTFLGDNTEKIINYYGTGYEIDENILGNNQLLFEEGKKYYLFLESWEDEYFPSTIYVSVHNDAIIKIDNNALFFQEEMFGEIKSEKHLVDNLEAEITQANKTLTKHKKKLIKTKAKDIYELVSLSNFIAIVKPTEIIDGNNYAKFVQGTVMKNIKGELPEEIKLYLPSEELIGNEYLIFGNDIDGAIRITTREGSFFKKGTVEFDKVYKEITKQ